MHLVTAARTGLLVVGKVILDALARQAFRQRSAAALLSRRAFDGWQARIRAADQLDRAVTRAHSLSGLLDAALTASLTQISVRQNDDMRKISAWVAMAAIPTMVAGIYGMNFDEMPELHWRFGYPAVLASTAAAVALLYRQFKKSGWL